MISVCYTAFRIFGGDRSVGGAGLVGEQLESLLWWVLANVGLA